MPEDGELLRLYAATGSEDAFSEVVRRHVDLVYNAALRQTRDRHDAEDVVQLVFASLARQAKALAGRPVLLSWLYTAVHYTAAKTRRAEIRREERQMKAVDLHDLTMASGRDPDWDRLRLVLDEAMHDLAEAERQVILIRFFQGRTFPEMSGSLGLSEDGARKRLDRAVEKLRAALGRRGITSTATAVATVLSTHPIVAAPAGMATAAAANALASAKLAGIVSQTLAMSTLQKALVAAVLMAAISAAVFEYRQLTGLRAENDRLQQALADSQRAEQVARRARDEARQTMASRPGALTPDIQAVGGEPAVLTPLEKMKSWLAKMPELEIPELSLLSADDWAQLAKRFPLDTENQARGALRSLRGVAKQRLGLLMQEALRAYLAANGDQLPSEPSQLGPYFSTRIGPEILSRYAMVRPDASAEAALATSVGNGGVVFTGPITSDGISVFKGPVTAASSGATPATNPALNPKALVIAEKPESVVDPDFDALISFSQTSVSTRIISRTLDAHRAAVQKFSELNGGQKPTTLDQLRPFITSPVNQELLQQIFYETIASKP